MQYKMSENNNADSGSGIVFKKKNKKSIQIRKRKQDDESNDSNEEENEEDQWKTFDEFKEAQKLKAKVRGINVLDSTSITTQSTPKSKEHVKEEKFGLIDAKKLVNELDLGNTFSAETNRRDEDTDMMKYIEEELAKRKGMLKDNIHDDISNSNSNSADDVLFNILPQHLIKTNVKKSEEMLSNQMLSGIPEVELGIEERIRNIEATEEARMKLLESRRNKSSSKTETFVPTNIAACFVHHNRFNIEDGLSSQNQNQAKKQKTTDNNTVIEPVVVIGDQPVQAMLRLNKGSQQNKFPGKDKATDDYIFEKFKKQFKK